MAFPNSKYLLIVKSYFRSPNRGNVGSIPSRYMSNANGRVQMCLESNLYMHQWHMYRFAFAPREHTVWC